MVRGLAVSRGATLLIMSHVFIHSERARTRERLRQLLLQS